jgi:hypothetical protein
MASELAARLQPIACEVLTLSAGPGRTSANLGAKSLIERGVPPTLFASESEKSSRKTAGVAAWKWAAAAGLLLLLSFSLRYAEAAMYKSRVSRSLDQLIRYKATLPKIDHELSFLNFIKTNQPPYLDTLAIVASAAPPGTRIDALSIVRHGDLSMNGSMAGDPQGPGNFRAKLVDSGFFARVVLEEQTPVDNGQKMNFRMSAQLKPEGMRKAFTPPQPVKGPTNQPATNSPKPAHAHPLPPQLTQN